MRRGAAGALRALGLIAAALALAGYGAGRAQAQTDEIQVYNAEIAKPGVFNLTLHDNYTPDGAKSPAKFDAAYREVTQGCNACHLGLEHPFIVIRIPQASTFPDQDFTAQKGAAKTPHG